MESLMLKKWCDFCEGNINLDTSYFLTMFHDSISDKELDEIFKYFPCSSELSDRVRKVQSAMYSRRGLVKSDPERCIDLAVRDLLERMKASEVLGDVELIDVVSRVSKKFTLDFSMIATAQNDDWNISLIENTNDYLNSAMISRELHYYAIFEAFYGMTTLFPIKWYLSAPLTRTSIDFTNYLKIWELRGDYVLTENEFLVSQDLSRN
ncbi:hypothetical protein [Photobacterium arenosum]|uniref:hypothetical protein n=1 Tax=Photobacterium arenosum TaxID=2774143 RepID=UPI00288B0E2F|nr:hypothetical protein [Photobacterium arenosum]